MIGRDSVLRFWAQSIYITGNPAKSLRDNFPMTESVNAKCMGHNLFDQTLSRFFIGFGSANLLNRLYSSEFATQLSDSIFSLLK